MTGFSQTERQAALGLLARSASERLAALWSASGFAPDYTYLRAPEIGLVMTRARAGGDGGAFNLGETTAVRCSVRLEGGEEGHGYALGRDRKKAETIALLDALSQTDAAARIRADILAPLQEDETARRRKRARRAAATKVSFFTMVRGDTE